MAVVSPEYNHGLGCKFSSSNFFICCCIFLSLFWKFDNSTAVSLASCSSKFFSASSISFLRASCSRSVLERNVSELSSCGAIPRCSFISAPIVSSISSFKEVNLFSPAGANQSSYLAFRTSIFFFSFFPFLFRDSYYFFWMILIHHWRICRVLH